MVFTGFLEKIRFLAPKPNQVIKNCFWSLLTMGGGIYGVQNYDIKFSLNQGGGVFTANTTVFDTRFIKYSCIYLTYCCRSKKTTNSYQIFKLFKKSGGVERYTIKFTSLFMQNFATSLKQNIKNSCKLSQSLKKLGGLGAFDTKFTLYSWFMLNFTSSSINRKLAFKMFEKIVVAVYTKGINYSYEEIIWGIKLPGKLKKKGGVPYRIH